MITITLSAADASCALNPEFFCASFFSRPSGANHVVPGRAAGAVFLKGFKEAIGIAVTLECRVNVYK
jgi:hypothetical protein